MDFLSDQLFDGRQIRILTVVDAFSKLSPAIDVRFRYTGADVVATLNRVTGIYGVPQTIRVDNGPEFVSRSLDLWAYQHGVVLDFSRPGTPIDNSFVEAFNGKVRAECIDQNWFLSLADARLKCETFRHEYNGERPHISIGHKTPASRWSHEAGGRVRPWSSIRGRSNLTGNSHVHWSNFVGGDHGWTCPNVLGRASSPFQSSI
ncbi:integrase-like protein [Microvirga subterranea]|uniref:Integrase-like protein n=1 Tax=Microvirga subterranea TaxID=186651 RepID=A0A370HKF0_9HYPH|nr:integrase-like protein [Microvirga subterranea]